MVFSRRAAAAYVSDLKSALKERGLPVTAANVRLAFLVGPFAAVRVLRTRPNQPLRRVLSADAISANPFMSGATVAMLVRKAADDVSATAPGRSDLLQGEPAADAIDTGREPAVAAVDPGREPAAAAVAPGREPVLAAAEPGREPAGTPVALEGEPTATTPTDVKCEIGLASCRKWIALQERKGQLVGRSAQR
jgi:hypothetical protein